MCRSDVRSKTDGRMDEVLSDAYHGRLKPLYNHLKDLPDITDAPIPILHHTDIDKKVGVYASFDIGRGCPFECSFCTIINVHGRKSRFRTADDLEKIVREDAGIRVAFPSTWPVQAKLAADGLWDALEKFQDELKGGRRA